jgi:trk system potassium uptake protein TrkA
VRTLGEEAAEAIELEVPKGSGYDGRSLGDIGLPAGVLVGALARPGEPAVLPDPGTVIQAGDRVIFFALEDAVKALEARILNGDSGSRRRD